MEKCLENAFKNRRSHYFIRGESAASDKEIEAILTSALLHVPSAFHSQSTRMVLLLGNEHAKLWEIVKDALKAKIPEEAFAKTR